jgi:hypothetical protein
MAHELGHEGFGAASAAGMDSNYGQGMGGLEIINTLAGGAKAGQQAINYANQLYPQVAEADPWEAALRFFLKMGQDSSVPGATAVSAAFGAAPAALDYLTAKKKEKSETDRARMTAAVQLAPNLKAPAKGKTDYIQAVIDNVAGLYTSTEIDAAKAEGKTVEIYEKPSATTSTFRERKFYKTGLPAAVVKNETDAALFESDGWSAVPPEGWSESVDAGGFETQTSQILDGGLIVFAGKGGESKVVRAGTNEEITGDEALAAIKEAQDLGVELQTRRAGGRRAATVAVNTSLTAFDQVAKSRSNIANLEEAKRLVLEEGANTGFLAAKFPNWKASTVALETVKNELGLDVVGSVTFGALSQGELNLALNTALPTELSEGKLVDWIDRKITAQAKLQDYLYAQAIYLADGDKTIGDWLRKKRKEKKEADKEKAKRRQEGTDFDFTTMTAEKIVRVDISTLNATQLADWNRRMTELGL